MSAQSSAKTPSYRRYKPKNLAVVRIHGKDHYLGSYDSPESWERYYRLVADWHAGQTQESVPAAQPSGYFAINFLIEAYLAHAQAYYRHKGEVTREYGCLLFALDPLQDVFGLQDANQFGPKALKTYRQHLIQKQWSRTVINACVSRVKRMFKWGVAEELIAPSTYHGLLSVAGLSYGRSDARETEPIKPVDDAHINRTLPYLHRQVRAMVQLQRLTGMRPCEVVRLRPADIDRSQDVWTYEPLDHKNRWRGHRRQIPLGPKAQEVLTPFLKREAEAFCFSPIEAEAERNAERRRQRRSPMTPSQARRRRKTKPLKPPRECYDTDAYRRAISYGIRMANKRRGKDEAEIPAWYPLQIRHSRATEVRRQYGLDGAQSALGHKNADITQVYAEKNLELAVRIARETG